MSKNQKSKLTIIGSSALFPLPRTKTNVFADYLDIENYEKHFTLHDDPICNSAKNGGPDRRTRSSLALCVDDEVILFDAGPDIRYQLNKYHFSPTAVCVTHDHSDACYGLRYLPDVTVYRESAKNIEPGVSFFLGEVTVTPFRVEHSTTVSCVGYRVEVSGKKIAYFTDIKSMNGIQKYIQDCDIIFPDGSILERDLPSHLSMVNQLKFYKEWGIKKVIFTHIGHSTLPHEELRKYLQARYQYADVAYDGMEIEF